jgi:hypothetical protein
MDAIWGGAENLPAEWLASSGLLVAGGLFLYFYLSITLTVIAAKTGTPNSWLAWVPLLNLFLMGAIARRSYAWVFALLVPCLNILALAYIWGGIAEARGRSAAWGLLIFVPGLNLLLPLILALGRSTTPPQPGSTSQPATCPKCRGPLNSGDAFCGGCGYKVPPAAMPQPVPPARSGGGCWVAALGLAGGFVLMLVLCGVGGYLALQPAMYAQPPRQPPAIPPGIAGTMAVLPRDSHPTSPALPSSFTSQTFGQEPGGFGGDVKIPASQLPPGVDPSLLPQVATAVSGAVYQTDPSGPAVNIQVLNTPPGNGAAGQITDRVTQAVSGVGTGISVNNPLGGTFEGTRIDGNGSTIYVLFPPSQEIVICIYTADPAGAETAGRLAAALGNGQGINDPQFDPYVCVLPSADPPELTLQQVEGLSGVQPMQMTTELAQDPTADAEMRQLLTQFQVFIPDRIVVAGYQDSEGLPWHAAVCIYGDNSRAWRTWQFVRWLFGWGSSGRLTVNGVDGLYFDSGQERLLIFCKGPHLVILQAPAAAALERLQALADSLQL